MADHAAPISKSGGYVVCRAWRLGPGRVAYVWLPCDADGCITITRQGFARLTRYVELLMEEVAIARGERDDPALAEADPADPYVGIDVALAPPAPAGEGGG